MNYNSELEGNNAGLRQILNAVNNLPSANDGGCVLTDEEKKEIATEAAEQLQPQLDELSGAIADLETDKADKVYLVTMFEELKTALKESNLDAAIAVLDKAILDFSTIS